MSIRRFLIPLLFVAVAAVSCGGKRTTYHDPNMDFSLLQTVAVLPFDNLSRNANAGERVRNVFVTMLQATGAVYVLPPGEVARGMARASVANPTEPTPEEIVAFAKIVGADAVLIGTLREYGEVRSGTSTANLISVSVHMMEARTGRVVWSGSSTKGGIDLGDRLFGGGGRPMNAVTQEAVDDLLAQLFSN